MPGPLLIIPTGAVCAADSLSIGGDDDGGGGVVVAVRGGSWGIASWPLNVPVALVEPPGSVVGGAACVSSRGVGAVSATLLVTLPMAKSGWVSSDTRHAVEGRDIDSGSKSSSAELTSCAGFSASSVMAHFHSSAVHSSRIEDELRVRKAVAARTRVRIKMDNAALEPRVCHLLGGGRAGENSRAGFRGSLVARPLWMTPARLLWLPGHRAGACNGSPRQGFRPAERRCQIDADMQLTVTLPSMTRSNAWTSTNCTHIRARRIECLLETPHWPMVHMVRVSSQDSSFDAIQVSGFTFPGSLAMIQAGT